MTKIIGHRGAAGLALENTIKSINAALGLPIYGVEIDVKRTQDGKLIILHDTHTGHVSSKTLLAHQSTLAELRKLTLHNDEKIPTLEEALKVIGQKMTVMIDIKDEGIVDEALTVLAKFPNIKAVFSGRQYSDLKRLHQLRPDIPFLIQHHYDPMEVIHRAKRMSAIGICLNMWLMNPLTYRLARQQGLEVYVYTVNRRWLLLFFQKFYPDAIIISDHPEKLI